MNNLLAGIIGKAYLAKKSAQSAQTIEYLGSIEDLSHLAADMVKQLLLFSRISHVEMKPIPIVTILKETAKTAQLGVPENITYTTDICDDKLTVYGDAVQLQQVLMNLISNARDALSGQEHGEIIVSLKTLSQNQKNSMILSVADNGTGINDDDLAHIFEPFFSTKEMGQGTGLGLSTLYGTIETHHGHIQVDSKLGEGTKFTISLPTMNIVETPTIKASPVRSATDAQCILIIDDEESLRNTLKHILSSLGYKVYTAVDGQHGIDTYEKFQAEITLVITDIIMPNRNGYAAIEAIRDIKHQIPVIYMTGYDSNQSEAKLHLNANTKLIHKPFKIDELSQLIYDILA